jgi:DNA-binding transcriptional LysR family regulator
MADIDWTDLQIFMNAARAGSFNAAAETAPLNQSTISRRIVNLEGQLGIMLFNRTARGITLTPTGEAIIELVSEMEGKVREIEARASEEMGLTGVIRLWVSEGVGGYWLPPRMKEFHRRFPGITVDVQCSLQPPALGTSDVDVALSWHRPEHPDAVILSEGTMVLKPCASLDYLATHGIPRTLSDLLNHRLCDNTAFPKNGEWKTWVDLIKRAANVSFQTNSSLALSQAALNGVGISLQPIGLQIREPTLKMLDLEGYTPTLQFYLTSQRQSKDIPRIRALIDYIKSELFTTVAAGTAFTTNNL